MKVIDNEFIEVYKLEIDVANTGHITNCYVIKDKQTSKVCVIDPAYSHEEIEKIIQGMEGFLDSVIVTHCHADHIAALKELVDGTKAKIYIHKEDYNGLYDASYNYEVSVRAKVHPVDEDYVVTVQENDIIEIGNTSLEVIHTPGHTIGSVVLYDEKNNILYSGDTIFDDTYGRTDLITGSHTQMGETLDKLFNRFEDIQVFSGHGEDFNLKYSKRKIRLLFAYKG